jgi:general secretion pathway protein F
VASFHFKAIGANGKVRTGALSGEDEKAVARELRRQGLTPVYVGAHLSKTGIDFKMPDFRSQRYRDVLFFTQELSTLLSAGIPLDRALSIAGELTERPKFRQVIQDVLRLVKGGRSLADSLAHHPEQFGELYVNMVRAGEAAGSLDQVFQRLVEFEKSRDELRSFIITSMVYPILLALVGLGSVLVLLEFVVPRFAAVFEESRLRVPLPAQMMMEVSKILETYGLPFLAAIIISIFAFRTYIRTPAGRLWWDSFKLKVPLLGDALRKAETARFARAMSTLVGNSVPLVQSIGISRAILNNKEIAGSLESVSQGVKRGEGIAAPLRRSGAFPALAGHLLSVGEETGRLDQMFARMAEIYEADTRDAVKRFTSLFEPLVILIMGVLVGGLILSMLLAITSINEVAL